MASNKGADPYLALGQAEAPSTGAPAASNINDPYAALGTQDASNTEQDIDETTALHSDYLMDNGQYHWDDGHGNEVVASHPPPVGAKPYEGPTAAEGNGSNFLAGMGKAFVDTATGAKQLYHKLTGHPESTSESTNSIWDTNDAAIQNRRQSDEALMHTKAGFAGNVAGQVAESSVIPGGLVGQAVGSGILGGLQATTSGENRLVNAGLGAGGALVGGVAGKTVGRLIQPVTNSLKPGLQASVDILKNAGVDLPVSRQTGSSLLNAGRRVSEDLGQKQDEALQKSFTGAVLKRIGAEGTEADPATMIKAKANLEATRTRLLSENPLDITDPTTWNNIQNISQDAGRGLSRGDSNKIREPIARLINAQATSPSGTIPPQVWSDVRSDVSALSSEPGAVKFYGGQLGNELDQMFARQATTPGAAAEWAKNQTQFGNLKAVEKSLVLGGGNQITPSKLAQVIDTNRNISRTVYDPNYDLGNLAGAGKEVLSDIGNSGTNPRFWQTGMLAGGLEAARDAARGDFSTAAKLAAFGVLAPKIIKRLDTGKLSKKVLPYLANNKVINKAVIPGVTRLGAGAGAVTARQGSQSVTDENNQ